MLCLTGQLHDTSDQHVLRCRINVTRPPSRPGLSRNRRIDQQGRQYPTRRSMQTYRSRGHGFCKNSESEGVNINKGVSPFLHSLPFPDLARDWKCWRCRNITSFSLNSFPSNSLSRTPDRVIWCSPVSSWCVLSL